MWLHVFFFHTNFQLVAPDKYFLGNHFDFVAASGKHEHFSKHGINLITVSFCGQTRVS